MQAAPIDYGLTVDEGAYRLGAVCLDLENVRANDDEIGDTDGEAPAPCVVSEDSRSALVAHGTERVARQTYRSYQPTSGRGPSSLAGPRVARS